MRIPQPTEQWIVCLLMLGVGVAALRPASAEPGVVPAWMWVVVPAIAAIAGTACYLGWRWCLRLLAKRLGVDPDSAAVRVIVGISFLALVLLMFVPIRTHAVWVDLPPPG